MRGPDEEERPPPVEVPAADLSAEALRGVVESYVLREGTDYGEREWPFETKVAQVLERIHRGEARILFDPASETIDIVPAAKPSRVS